MAKTLVPLTSLDVRKLKAGDKSLRDGQGLYLVPQANGRHLWRLDYRHRGARKTISLGIYPETGLADARQRRSEARKLLADGLDPSAIRQEAKAAQRAELAQVREAVENNFEAIAREWMARQAVAEVTAAKNLWLLETYLFPELGPRPIRDLSTAPREILDMLRKIETSGKLETAKRAQTKLGQIFRYALLEGKADADPTASLRGAIQSPKVKHHAAVTEPGKVGELLRAIDGFSGQPVTLAALRLAPLVFVRPGELRHAEWCELDMDADHPTWRIPGQRMKMKTAHIVPLSTQAVVVLKELQVLTGAGRYVFPSVRTAQRPMSENTVNAALRRLGYGNEEMTGHGFRSMAATRLNEMGWRADAIERQLAHAESNKVRDAYTHAAQYLGERRQMMQAWADELDKLKRGADVIPLRRIG